MNLSMFIPNLTKVWTLYWKGLLLDGLRVTLEFTLISVLMGVMLGIIVAILKMSKSKVVRFFVAVYIEVIRGTPILLQLFVFVFALPQILTFAKLSKDMWVAIALSINSSAYVSEVIRSGIQAVDKGQTEAARSLGLSSGQTMIKIILPQAIKNILPALGNEFIMMLKETSLASTFFIGDLMTYYKTINGATYIAFETLVIIGMIYLAVTFPLSKLVAYFEKRMSTDKSYKKPKHSHDLRSMAGGKL